MPLPEEGSGTIALPHEPVALGDVFAFVVTGTEGLKNPRIWVSAHQGAVLVYGEGIGADEEFKLGGGSSQWRDNGGPAECVARLYCILNKNGKGEWSGRGDQGGTLSLAECSFTAEG